MAYTTTTIIEYKLKRSLTTEESNYFSNVLDGAIDAYINLQTGTKFNNSAAGDVYASGKDESMLVIPTMSAITAVAKVADDGTETTVPTDNYVKYPRTAPFYAIRRVNSTWDGGLENYKVTGKLGYANVPEDIKMVATELAINALNENDNNYKSEKVGDWSVTYAEADKSISKESMQILASYQRLSRSM